jgi:hypothetical protein
MSLGEAFWVAKTEPGTWTLASPKKDEPATPSRN